jgi:hypothetical protein
MTDIIPWNIRLEHIGDYWSRILHTEQRSRGGALINHLDMNRLMRARNHLADTGNVIDYNPEPSHDPFTLVERREGVDLDMIREPLAEPANGDQV